MSDAAKCGRVRGWMADAASGLLSDARHGEFEKHIGDCAACRVEFARIENLVERIDESLRTELALEPSPKLVLVVRESIAAEPQSPAGWLTRNSWLSAGVCATVAALLIFVVAHRANRAVGKLAPQAQIANSVREMIPGLPARVTAAPSRSAPAENVPPRATARAHSGKSRLAVAREELPHNPHSRHSEPEVIVQPGQMQAILQFVAEMQNGKINGVAIEKGIQEAQKPLEIKPLEITPLDASAGESSDPRATSSHESGSSNGRLE